MNNTCIQIITPVYNTGGLLFKTFETIQEQSKKDFSWIIVDDCSDDKTTLDILTKLQIENNWINVIRHSQNRGLPVARNTGVKAASGKYIFFLDGDDLIDPTFIEKAFLFLEAHKEYAFVNSYVIGFGAQQYLWQGGFHDREVFLEQNRNTSCFMAHRKVFDTLCFDENMLDGCEDWDFWLQAASKGFWGYTIPEYLFHYRRSAKSKWDSLKSEKKITRIKESLQQKYGAILRQQGFPNPKLRDYSFGISQPQITYNNSLSRQTIKTLFCFFPWLEIGGADQFNLQLLEGLKEKGWLITIITTKKNVHTLQEKFQIITDDIFHLANLGEEHNYPFFIQHLIESRNPSTVFISNSMYAYYLLPWMRHHYPGIAISDYVHCEDPGWYNGGYPFFSSSYSSLLDKTYVTSQQLKKWCINKGADANKIEVCYINTDIKKIYKNNQKRELIRQQLGITSETSLLIYVARLTAQKQPHILTRVLAELKRKQSNYKCLIVGDGPEKETLLQNINQLKLSDYIIYKGAVDNNQVLDYMDAADIFFLPSLYEGIALSIYEAMAKKLVIVGADTGGQAELVTPECGFLILKDSPKQEVADYAAKLELLITNPLLTKEMGTNGRKRVEEKFNLQAMVTQMDQSLSSIAAISPVKEAFEKSYLLILDRMLHLENTNAELYEKTNSKAVQFLLKHKRSYQRAKKVYQKVKHILKG